MLPAPIACRLLHRAAELDELPPDAGDVYSISAVVDLIVGDHERVCRVCSCTHDRPCEGGCGWVDDPAGGDLCSTCAFEAWEVARRQALGLPVDAHALELYTRWLDLGEAPAGSTP